MSIENYKKMKKGLKEKRQKGFEQEQKAAEEANAPKVDERLLAIGPKDEDIIIHLLPQGDSERTPRVKFKMHWLSKIINGKKKSLFWKCRKTLGDDESCPSDDRGSELWIDGASKQQNEEARMYYRKDRFAVNALVVDNPNAPEMNGQVKILPYGGSIEKIIQAKIRPKKNKNGKIMKKGIDVFDPIDGPNFTLSCENDGNNDYTNSYFDDEPTPIATTNKEFDRIMNACYNLDEIYLDESTFLSVEEIQKRFNKFESGRVITTTSENVSEKEEVDGEEFTFDDDDVDTASEDLDFDE